MKPIRPFLTRASAGMVVLLLALTATGLPGPRAAHSAPIPASPLSFMYVDEGLCTTACGNATPDAIEVYDNTTLVQTFNTTMDQAFFYPGSNTLAPYKAGSGRFKCILGADSYGAAGIGNITSYQMAHGVSGMIQGEVSNIADPAGGTPVDVKTSPTGTRAVVADLSGSLTFWSISPQCVLTLLNTVSVPGASYTNTAFIGGTQVAAADPFSGMIAVFKIVANTLVYQTSTPAQLAGPNGISGRVMMGEIATGFNSSTAMAEVGKVSHPSGAITFIPGSPATDSGGGSQGVTTIFTGSSTLIQGDNNSGTLGNYALSPSMSWVSDTTTGAIYAEDLWVSPGPSPNATLWLNGVQNGNIVVCKLSSGFATACGRWVTLANTSGMSNGMVITAAHN